MKSGHLICSTQTCGRAMFGGTDFEFSSPWMENVSLQKGYGFQKPDETEKNRKKRIQLTEKMACIKGETEN